MAVDCDEPSSRRQNFQNAQKRFFSKFEAFEAFERNDLGPIFRQAFSGVPKILDGLILS